MEKAMLDELTGRIIGAAIEVHQELGPGLLESAYEECLCRELLLQGLKFERQVALPVNYKGITCDCGYRIDIIVGGCVVIELKAIEKILPIHKAQVITYLKLSGYETGLLLNFNTETMREGVNRLFPSKKRRH